MRLWDMGWWTGDYSKDWRHPWDFIGRGWKEWKQDSEAGNFVNGSASAKIGDSFVDQIKEYYFRNSPVSLFEPPRECLACVYDLPHSILEQQQQKLVKLRRGGTFDMLSS